MHRRIGRLAGLAIAGGTLLAVAGSALAATPAKLTAVVAEDATSAPASSQAWIRVLHGSPDAPAVDVYVDGAKAITSLAFAKITDYTPLAAGNHAIKVCATGSTTVCPIDVPALAVADGKKYTIAAADMLAKIKAQVIEDAPSASVAPQAQVRVVHLSADTPAVDVLTADGATKLVTNLSYPNASAYLSLAANTYSVKVCASPADTLCPLGPLSLTVAAGKAYSVFAVGSLASATATMPPTDIATGITAGSSGSGLAAAFAFLVVASILGVALSIPFATRRVRR